MRRLWILVLLLGCAKPPAPPAQVVAGTEPTVRVWLRSLNEPAEFLIEGKGGLKVETDDVRQTLTGPLRATRYKGGPGLLLDVEGNPVRERIDFEPVLGVFTIDGKHTYAGRLEWRNSRLINVLPLENYVLGVLRGELPLPQVPKQAAAAQAIAVRSYTLHYLRQERENYDVDDTTLFQRYVGLRYAPQDRNLRAGVQDTLGLCLFMRNKPLKTYYHSTCGGRTTDVPTGLNREPLGPMSGVVCTHCRASKYYRWQARIDAGVFVKAAGLSGALEGVEIVEKDPGGRARRIKVTAGGASQTVHAGELRLRIGGSRLRSTKIDSLRLEAGVVRLEGGGWGHGVGLCQMGAIGQAGLGRDGAEIVAHYYRGAELRRAY